MPSIKHLFRPSPLQLAALAAALLGFSTPAIAQSDNGLVIQRTLHENSDGGEPFTQRGTLFTLKPSIQGASVVGFWIRRDLEADSEEGGANNSTVASSDNYFISGSSGSGNYIRIKHNEFPDDGEWHYIHIQIFPAGSSGGNNLFGMNTFLDGTLIDSGSGSRASGRAPIYIGAALDSFKRQTAFAYVVDDLTIWRGNDAEVLGIHQELSDFGSRRLPDFHQKLINHWTFDEASDFPPSDLASYEWDQSRISGTTIANNLYITADTSRILTGAPGNTITGIEINVQSDYGQTFVSPAAGQTVEDYSEDSTDTLSFTAPQYVYFDRDANELGSSDSANPSSFLGQAHYRAVNVGYVVNGQQTDTGGNALRTFTQGKTADLNIEWLWELEYAIIQDASGQPSAPNSNQGAPVLSLNGSNENIPIVGRRWVQGTSDFSASVDGTIEFASGTTTSGIDSRFALKGFLMTNHPGAPENSLKFSGDKVLWSDTGTLSGGDVHADATSSSVDVPVDSLVNATFEFWARPAPSGETFNTYLQLGRQTATNDTFRLFGFDENGRLYLGHGTREFIPAAYADFKWHHWAITYDNATGDYRFYRDGQLVHSFNKPTDFSILDLNGPNLSLGAFHSTLPGTSPKWFSTGEINNVRIFNEALTAAEIRANLAETELSTSTDHLLLQANLNGFATQSGGYDTTSATLNTLAGDGSVSATQTIPLFIAEVGQQVQSGHDGMENTAFQYQNYATPPTRADTLDATQTVVTVSDWARMQWFWSRESRLELLTITTESDGSSVASLPYVLVDGQDLYSAGINGAWVGEESSVTVGTRYRIANFPDCQTLSDITNATGGLSALSDQTVVDGTAPDGQPSRELVLNVIAGPGSVTFNYDKTIYRAEVPLGEFLDVATLGDLNAHIVPDLCPGANLDLINGPSAQLQALTVGAPNESLTERYVYDAVGQRLIPTSPGITTIEWPDANGATTHSIQITAHFPGEAVDLPHDREDPANEGYRLGSAPIYDTGTVMGDVSDAFPGSPSAHYQTVYDDIAEAGPIPLDLDANPNDRWALQRITYTDSIDIQIPTEPSDTNLRATGAGRAVALFSYREDPTRIATGDVEREAQLTRVIEVAPHSDVVLSEDAISSGERQALALNETIALYAVPEHTGDRVAIGNDFSTTLEFWAKLDEDVTDASLDRILWHGDVSSSVHARAGFRGPAHPTNPGAFFFETFDPSTPATATAILNLTASDIQADEHWHHWALVFDATSDTQTIYLDGRIVAESDTALSFAQRSTNNRFHFGASLISGSPSDWLNGSIDNLGYWDYAASTEQVRSMMRGIQYESGGGAEQTPFWLFRMDEGFVDETVTATSSNDRDLTIRETPSIVATSADLALFTPAEDTFPEVATRIRSRLDTAGFGTPYQLFDTANYNAELYDRSRPLGQWGPLFPVNWSGVYSSDNEQLNFVWYQNFARTAAPIDTIITPDAVATLHPNVDWPSQSIQMTTVDFPASGKDKDARIYISSRLGSEGVDANGDAQMIVDPAVFDNFSVYNQPDPASAGYNPNEEHALIEASKAASFLDDPDYNLGQDAAFALQRNLNQTTRDATYTSDPWVLTQFQNSLTGEWEMRAYEVEHERDSAPVYEYRYAFNAGDIVVQPYPLNRVVGNVIMTDDTGGNIIKDNALQRTLWFDKNEVAWVVSGDGLFYYQFWYPFRQDFWYDFDRDGEHDINVGKPIAWAPENDVFLPDTNTAIPRRVLFDTFWASDYPKLKRGEVLAYPGGENKADNPLDAGLPALIAMESAQIVYDSNTPTMEISDEIHNDSGVQVSNLDTDFTARITRPLERFEADFPLADMPIDLTPANTDRIMTVAERWYFRDLVGSLQKRFYYDSLREKLVLRGRINDRESGDPNLTVTPITLFALEPAFVHDPDLLRDLDSGSTWTDAIDAIIDQTRNPHGITETTVQGDRFTGSPPSGYYAGLMPYESDGIVPYFDASFNEFTVQSGDRDYFSNLSSFGTGSVLLPNPTFLNQRVDETFYVTIVENNHPDANSAISLHIIEVVPERFRGGIKLIEAQDIFDEKVNLAHTAYFAGDPDDIFYEWWIRDPDNLAAIGTPETDAAWQLYDSATGLSQIQFQGRPDIALADKMFFVRYGATAEIHDVTGQSNTTSTDSQSSSVSAATWRLVDINNPSDTWERIGSDAEDGAGGPVPFQWAGASNSPQLQANGSRKYIPQLIMGWVKRVLDRVNPYEARYADFFNNESPATYSSQIQIAGAPYIGPVALNADPDVLENVGLIELYETVLDRALALTLDINGVATDSTNQAVLLAATRLSFLYELLGSEAYSDAQNPLVPISDDNGLADAAPFIHAFQNQEPSLLAEELALLRGTDFVKAYPSFNRLFWNFVKGTGEAAYNEIYRIQDVTGDGFINEFDAAEMYPQGHGDAWGHYLSAVNQHYALLNYSEFQWQARDELYSLLDNVIEADFLDEKSFARVAAAKARTGMEIVRGTYREAYVADPAGQWQGYEDTVNPARAWGVSEWAGRAGQGALFDWITANSLVPAEADDSLEGLAHIDRRTNRAEINEIAAALRSIQHELDGANRGANPIGFDSDTVVFDIDPIKLSGDGSGDRQSHFEQIYERALAASRNALTAFEFASEADRQLRKLSNDTFQLQFESIRQDIDFQNRLIEIFGTPYDGQIGPGKPFPEGYEGPDPLLYLYVDRVDTNQLYPAEGSSVFADAVTEITHADNRYGVLNFDSVVFQAESDFQDSLRDIFDEYYLTETPPTAKLDFPAPVALETSDYAFAVPDENGDGAPDWGSRSSSGAIQENINELLLEEATAGGSCSGAKPSGIRSLSPELTR